MSVFGSVNAQVVGTTSAEFGVTPSGSATYTVPIAVPVGTTGVQPKVALQYNSQGGNGLVGVGWSISGLSTISRCPTDLYLDDPANGGVGIDPVDYDDNDKFCLNGQRLVAINGAYGADGTEYRTVFEDFSKIVSYGSTGGAPTWFRVWKKSGEILEFGNSADSRVIGQSQTQVGTWALSKLADVKGNYVAYSYQNSQSTGEFHIDRIDYTGNDAQGLAPYNHIDFVFETRPDSIRAYMAGDKVQHLKRLTNVKVFAEGALAHDYRITYEAGATNRSRVASVAECGDANTCFAPTVFEWSADGTQEFNRVAIASQNAMPSGYRVYATGDFNGDGLTDLYLNEAANSGRAEGYPGHTKPGYVWLSNGDGTFNKISIAAQDAMPDNYNVYATGDFNGDGLTDVFLNDTDTYGRSQGHPGHSTPAYVWLSKGDGTFDKIVIASQNAMLDYHRVFATGDFDGDGLTDLYLNYSYQQGQARGYDSYAPSPNTGHTWLSNGDGTFNKIAFASQDAMPSGYKVYSTGDFNGDGLTDLYLNEAANSGRAEGYPGHTKPGYVWLSNGDGTFNKISIAAQDAMPDNYNVYATGDFNGDGLTDLYLNESETSGRAQGYPGHSKQGYVWLSKGNGTFEKITVANQDAMPDTYKVFATGDYNGDGLTDLYLNEAGSYGRSEGHPGHSKLAYVWLSRGDGTFTKLQIASQDAMLDYHQVFATGDFDGDGLTDLYLNYAYQQGQGRGYDSYAPSTDTGHTWLSNWSIPDLLTKATNGHALSTEIAYKPMTDDTVYTKGTGATYPNVDMISAANVVAQVKTDDGIGGQNTQSYSYEALRAQLKGVGNLGFEKMVVTDNATGIVSESVYSQDWANHHQGLLTQARTIAPGNIVMNDKTVTWDVAFTSSPGGDRCFRYSPTSTTTKRDLNGAFMSRIIENTTYDAYGYPLTITSETQNESASVSHTKITTNAYTHDASNWILGRLTDASVTHQSTGQTDQTRTSSFTYDSSGQLQSETVEPGSALSHTKTYARNAYGAVTSITETWGSTGTDGIAATSRTTAYTYDAKIRYKLTETNPLGHTQTTSYHPILALPVSTTGPNGLTTTMAYDVFGRATLETRADGTTTTTSRDFCGGSVVCPSGAIFRTQSQVSGGNTSEVFFDVLNRELKKQSLVDGQWSQVDTDYDALGRVSQKSEPYFTGGTIYWTTIQYDLLGRPLQTNRPDGSVQTMSYNGLTEVSTNELGQTKTVTKDVAGRPETITDALSQSLTYSYDALGQAISMTDGQVTSSYAYDLRGNKVSDTDPDKGTWTYRYNALGQLVEQTDAKGQVTEMTYDVLGRMLTRIDDATAANPSLRTATWTYDTATNGIGKLHTVSQPGYAITNSYDSLGRPISSAEDIDGTSYTSSTTYDTFSRPESVVYPSGITTKNIYDADGALSRVENNNASITYWERQSVDARGNITQFKLGNGVETIKSYVPQNGNLTGIYSANGANVVQDLDYTFDSLGNLTQRVDTRQNLTENFLYDNLNRVIEVETDFSGGNVTTVTMAYTSRGNIASKSDVGTYTYAQNHSGCTSGFAGPHALTEVAGTKNATYCYDLNGNMTSGDGRVVTYSAFDKPTWITKGSSSVFFSYGPDRARYKRVDQTTAGTTTTLYVGGKAFEKIIKPTETLEKHYIGDFAVITVNTATTITTTDYLHRDHLGSVDTITDAASIVLQRMSFDAWGKRRETNWQPMSEAARLTFDTSLTTRGFTGHEMVDSVGLLHMNGRVYDAELGRFLSADPFVQDTTNLQSWNRYSYVLNNPLSYTDPTGFFFNKIFKAIGKFFKGVFKAIGRIFKAILNSPIFRSIIQIAACFNPVTCVAAAGAIALATGGTIVDAVKAAAFAFIQMGVWDAVGTELIKAGVTAAKLGEAAFAAAKGVVHGVVGGALSLAQGGNFLEGFAANAIGAIGGVLGGSAFGDVAGIEGVALRTAVAAAAGCAAASAAGGKCANGAITAAFAHLYNSAALLRILGGGVALAAKTHATYLLRACETCPVEYVGRTSGLQATIDKLLYGRWIRHPHNDLPVIELDEYEYRRGAYAAIRGREQQLIDYYGGAKNDNPNTPLRNIRRGVGKNHKFGKRYWRASNRRFKKLYRYTGN